MLTCGRRNLSVLVLLSLVFSLAWPISLEAQTPESTPPESPSTTLSNPFSRTSRVMKRSIRVAVASQSMRSLSGIVRDVTELSRARM